MDRDAFLRRVRASIDAGPIQAPEPPASDGLVPDRAPGGLLDQFTIALTAVDGEVHTSGVVAAFDEIVARHGPGPFLTWDDALLPVAGASERLVDAGCDLVPSTVPWDREGRAGHQDAYFDVRFGLTGAEAAFAESGSIVVRSGPGRPRMASLIPLVHIVLLPADRIFRSQIHWMETGDVDLAGAANVVYVTGPSRTADIEQQINLGVHGPRAVHVVIV